MKEENFSNARAETTCSIKVDDIKRVVAANFPILLSDLESESLKPRIVLPRQIAMYLVRQITKQGFHRIGRQFGGRDRTTVMYAVNKISELMAADKDGFGKEIEDLMKQIEGKAGPPKRVLPQKKPQRPEPPG